MCERVQRIDVYHQRTCTNRNFTRAHAVNRKINASTAEPITAAINPGYKLTRVNTLLTTNKSLFRLSYSPPH